MQFFCNTELVAQLYADQVPPLKRYDPAIVVDPDEGIHMYDELIFALGGDSVRYDKKGYNVQTWVEDYYISGKMVHRGFYLDGQLTIFKNYYENGQVERSFRVIDYKRCELTVFYDNGKIRSEIFYYNQNPQKETDYFKDGTIEFEEVNEKDMEYLYKRNFYKPDGLPESTLEIIDKKKKTYDKKDFYPNGKVKEEGGMRFLFDKHDYVREGSWSFYDETGVLLKKENYQSGQLMAN